MTGDSRLSAGPDEHIPGATHEVTYKKTRQPRRVWRQAASWNMAQKIAANARRAGYPRVKIRPAGATAREAGSR